MTDKPQPALEVLSAEERVFCESALTSGMPICEYIKLNYPEGPSAMRQAIRIALSASVRIEALEKHLSATLNQVQYSKVGAAINETVIQEARKALADRSAR